MTERIPQHEAWRRAYRSRRYCRHLTQDELDQRIRDLILNAWLLTPEAKIGLSPVTQGALDMELFTHVLEEMALRHGPYPNGFTRHVLKPESFPDFVGELGRRVAAVFLSRGLTPESVLIKFGKSEHMRALLERGAIRVQAASYYARPDHIGAIGDDELSLPLSLSLTREDITGHLMVPEPVPTRSSRGRLDVTYHATTDYWLYCLSTTAAARLFVDFQADACVIIKDPTSFHRLLAAHGAERLPDSVLRHGLVKYVDPLLPETLAIDVPMSKHFRYKYQCEYRYVWAPVHPTGALPQVDLTLGNLEGIAELVIV
jgi:hypothetical protein